MTIAADITRLTAELADLQRRHPTTTAQTGLVLMKRIVKIKRKLISMGAARERVANITLVRHGGAVVTERFTIFDNPYDLDQMHLVKEVKRVTGGARVMHWGWAN
ncbi:hypothetical protein K0U83_24170 [bacterium]|jgi:hypothetical protein|nr:hypothetical protein [bacterium]